MNHLDVLMHLQDIPLRVHFSVVCDASRNVSQKGGVLKTVLTLTLLRNFKCDAGGLHMSLCIIELCSVAVSVVT